MTATPTLVLCADDYGLSPGVSRGIVELIGARRLSATGCMTASPFWPEHARWLKPLRGHADIGLHLSLTSLAPLGPMPLTAPGRRPPGIGALMRAALLGRIDTDEVTAEFARQLDAFESGMGRPPDFLDGHHHVHQLAGVREAVLALYARRLAGSGAWIRCCDERPTLVAKRGVAIARALAIGRFGVTLRRRAHAAGIPFNDGFAGVYDFASATPYADLFPRFLRGARGRHLVMCHPGHVDNALRAVDSLTDTRESEHAYFRSDAFPATLAAAGVRLGRFGS